MSGWIGVDLDGTLAEYNGWVSPSHIGPPVHKMLDRVKKWRLDGYEVRIFTARISDLDQARDARKAIEQWCLKFVGEILPITNEKDYGMIELWDDRCVQVVPNTGEIVGASTRGLSDA